MIKIILAILVLILASALVYLIKQAVREQKPEPKRFSKEEIKRREGSYFDNKEI